MRNSVTCLDWGAQFRTIPIGFLVLLSCDPAWGIDPHRTTSQYVRQQWGSETGFPRGPVYSIDQSKDGYLWIGTDKGLVRFDGQSFHLMQASTRKEAQITHVMGLMGANDGSLWVRLRRPGLTLLRFADGLFLDVLGDLSTRGSISTMGRDRDGNPLMWLLEGDRSALVRHTGKFETIASYTSFTRSAVLALAQTSSGDYWIGTRDGGLFRLSGGQVSAITAGLPDPKVNALVAIGNNELWVGTDGGIVRWDGTKLTRDGTPRSLDGVQALAMAVDRDANLWVGTDALGLVRVNAQGAAFLDNPGRGFRDAVTAVFEDTDGNIWYGSGSGLGRLRDSAFVSYSLPEGVPSDGSNPVLADSSGRMWFAPVSGGVGWLDGSKHGRITDDGLDKDVVYSIAGGTNGIWAGRQHGGLTNIRIDRGSVVTRTWVQAHGLAQDSVYSVHEARDGSVWAGTLSGGVSRFSGGKFTNYTIENGLLANTVNSIVESATGTMWFATPVGLSGLTKGKWESLTAKHGLPSEDVSCLLEDSTGVLWIGTAAGIAFRGPAGIRVPPALPAPLQEQIMGIAEDRNGWLWMATANHVLRVNRKSLLAGKLVEGDVREYGLADGLRGSEGVKRHRSVVADPAGRIWFSLNRGISMVDPGRIRSNAAPAIPRIQTLVADGTAIEPRDDAHIPGGSRRLVFRYAGVSLSIPERVRYRYRLDGFDQAWSEPVATREAVYTNLEPRTYRFRVIASNPDGVWSSNEAMVRFDVDPLFWQTWWFRAGSILGCILAVWAFYRHRVHQVTSQLNVRFDERLAERTRIAQELHDTLLQGFLSASMQVHVATDQLPQESPVKPTLTRALQLMRQVIEEGRNAVRGLRSSKTASLDLEQSFAQIQQELMPQGQGHDEVGFRVIVEGRPRPLHPLLRDEVYRIGREALVNAFRHAKAQSIEVELQFSSRRLRLMVRDDGCGIDPQVVVTGRDGHWGLSGMRERAERIHSSLHVRSSALAGTEVELTVPSHVAFQDHRNHMFSWISNPARRGVSNQPQNGEDR